MTVWDGDGVIPIRGGSVEIKAGFRVVVGGMGPLICRGWTLKGPWCLSGIEFPGGCISCLTSLGEGFRKFGIGVVLKSC